MTDNTAHFAKEADRLLSDDVLTAAFEIVKQGALEALATADADDKTMILRLQAKVAVIDDVRSGLRAAIERQAFSGQNEANQVA